MTTNNRDHQTGDEFADVLSGLEMLAQTLDAHEYPGQAWQERPGVAKPRLARRRMWKIAASLAAAAALVVVAVHYHVTSQQQVGPAEPGENAVARATAPANDRDAETGVFADTGELAFSEILLVEDLESYSIIDMTGDVPLVSFATKDSYTPVCAVPLLPEPPS